ELPKEFFVGLKNSISFIDFPVHPDVSILEPKKLLYSPYHVYAGILTLELVRELDRSNKENAQYTIGIISPYKAQSMLMNKLITSSGISSNMTVHCDTVHGFQGDECDIVIFVVNPNNIFYTGHPNSLLSKEYIYNVAISRAKDYLWILYPFSSIPNNPHINELREIAGHQTAIIKSATIEQHLFHDHEFILKNSYLTGHDNINVFGQVEMSYFIKAGSTAIDLQLRL
ncbi:MAG: C-terminal helicase domain-containing protein, partial [Imperialibacter sp.]